MLADCTAVEASQHSVVPSTYGTWLTIAVMPHKRTEPAQGDPPPPVRMCKGERPIGAVKGKQTNTMASCPPPPLGAAPLKHGGAVKGQKRHL